MRKIFLFSLFIIGVGPALAQEDTRANFVVERDSSSGELVLRSIGVEGQGQIETPQPDTALSSAVTSAAEAAQADAADFYNALEQQDIFVTRDGGGQINAVYAWPAGTPPPNDVLQSLEVGQEVERVAANDLLSGLAPSADLMREIMQAMLNDARGAVCAMTARPSEFGTEVDVTAGFGVTGRVAFNMSWDTEVLCERLAGE